MRVMVLTLLLVIVAGTTEASVVVSPPTKPSALERLAAQEIQRYVYVRTGKLPVISTSKSPERIVIARKDRKNITDPAVRKAARNLRAEEYILRTTKSRGRGTWWIVGGNDVGTLYGAYRFAEKIGVRFYLHGDVIPDKRLAKLPDVNETGKPIFSIRGINPFHDFPEGPDWWNTDDYLTYVGQLAKMRMNFIGLHCYPEGIAEPSVWIGLPSDVDARGKVSFSYLSRWANTALDGPWGYAGMLTSDYSAGASLLFPQDQYGSDVQKGFLPAPSKPDQFNTVFNRAGEMFGKAFYLARSLGVKTCVGTETPLTTPALVKERLTQQGKNSADPKVVQEIYKGMFTRIARAYPVDYYWLWTNENWTWAGNKDEELKAVESDINSALAALDSINNPFKLATCGWVLGPVHDRAALDKVLPKECPMSCINQNVGHAPVEPGFGRISGRPKWAIPWMENDPDMTAPQPWVGRMRYDAADARRLGCTGLIGIHWRTKIMAQNVAALADAAWDQSWAPSGFSKGWKPADHRIGPLGGQIVTYPVPIADTEDDTVYQSVRYNTDGYRLHVPSGVYTVTLKFNEPAYDTAGRRVFGVKIQGKQVLEHLDMFARVGKDKALDFTYTDIKVANGVLLIEFTREVEYPCIAGIVVEGRTDKSKLFVRKINSGGPRYNDYESDMSQAKDLSEHRAMPVESFYIDFARASFGDGVAVEAGRILAKIDGKYLPQPSHWLAGPGGLMGDRQPWDKVKNNYEFVDQLAALRKKVAGPGDRARFDYWLNTYEYMRTIAEMSCARGRLDINVEAITAEKDAAKQQAIARDSLDLRVRMSRLWERMITYQIAATDTPGEMGTIDNLERHSRKMLKFLTIHDDLLAKTLGEPLPKEVELTNTYSGPARIIAPTVRTQVKPGEAPRLKAIVLDNARPLETVLYWRPIGAKSWSKAGFKNVGRATYELTLPPAKNSFEYYMVARTERGKLVWPASAPTINQTVVVW